MLISVGKYTRKQNYTGTKLLDKWEVDILYFLAEKPRKPNEITCFRFPELKGLKGKELEIAYRTKSQYLTRKGMGILWKLKQLNFLKDRKRKKSSKEEYELNWETIKKTWINEQLGFWEEICYINEKYEEKNKSKIVDTILKLSEHPLFIQFLKHYMMNKFDMIYEGKLPYNLRWLFLDDFYDDMSFLVKELDEFIKRSKKAKSFFILFKKLSEFASDARRAIWTHSMRDALCSIEENQSILFKYY